MVMQNEVHVKQIATTKHMCMSSCPVQVQLMVSLNTLRPRQNGGYFTDNIFKSIFLNENIWI